MFRRVVVSLALVAGVAGTGAIAPARAAEPRGVPDLTGEWRLEPRRGDSMQPPAGEGGERGPRMGRSGPGGGGGPGGRGGRRSGGGWTGRGGQGGTGEVRGGEGGPPPGPRPVRLPELMHVTQLEGLVSFEDSTGVVLQEVTTLGAAKDTLSHAPGAPVFAGAWIEGRLEFQHPGPRGGSVTDSVALQDEGRTLIVTTRIAARGDMPAREFKRVYHRATDS